ncbi:phosphonate ABC transporter, permease protein PhnE [Pseudothauera nasutitermitis]|uniref:Phosphonate ABC transporter, permease protein PhnE n=1 Tax=Pseudothauera nasutitermitis TaxID=2565930 RepID=A0A4S4AZN9_9RHOO|nr:phosphonate ABC transporter, permease protein PhnE [Pseudothauera nasutitermitis]
MDPLAARCAAADRLFARRRLLGIGIPALILAYLAYVFFAFDVPGLAARMNPDNARILLADSYSYKTHVTQDTRSGRIVVAVEGDAKGAYPPGMLPDWVDIDGRDARVDLGNGQIAEIADGSVAVTVPGFGEIRAESTLRGIRVQLPEGGDGPRISQSDTLLVVYLDGARLTVTRTRIELFRYFLGWELFWFTLDSPYYGKSLPELLRLALSDERIEPEKSNLRGIFEGFWYNRVWQHGEVAWALFETVLMAFIGTFGAALIVLPLAFLAARGFSPARLARFGLRRVFDFLRGVDGLIWTIVLSRAFGPGPMTGALAILLTEIGTFGKLFSEALENLDEKQQEGVRSTGANALQRCRFGVIPQIMPVLMSQVLYYFESNTRSATIIGAIVGGGIGMFLTQAINSQKDWEKVAYYIVLVVILVMVMDSFSGWLRRKLIRGADA